MVSKSQSKDSQASKGQGKDIAMVMSSAAKKWKDFKSTLTRQFILPFANEKEKLKEPSQHYNFIEKSE
ncbi:unnamed protein product [Prunus brigantina]